MSSPKSNPSHREAGVHRRVDFIDWYYELSGNGPTIVLIPSGEGDCGSFEKVAADLSRQFTVLTFDMPGFSRSSDPPDFANYSMGRAARELAGLVQALELGPATFYGCSSGAHVALTLAAEHPDLVRNIAIHEIPLSVRGDLGAWTTLDDDGIVRACQGLFRNQMNENGEAWDALGQAYHKRLERNYVTWVRRYVGQPRIFRPFAPEELRRRPVTWTIGGLSPAFMFFDNVVTAQAAGIPIGLLMCKHFPQVSIPDVLADHIGKVARG